MAYWGAIASAASAYLQSQQANDQANATAAMNKDELNQKFQNDEYSTQEKRKWSLEDRNHQMKNIQGFEKYAPASAMNFNGAGPPQREEAYDTSNLDQFDPGKEGSLIAYMKGHQNGQ